MDVTLERHKRKARRSEPRPVRVRSTVVIIVVLVSMVLGYTLFKPVPVPVPVKSTSSSPVAIPPQRIGEVTFLSPDKREKATITVEIVADERSRALGLMHRRSLGRQHGMLFIFDRTEIQSFWMKNTFIPLDMIFVNEEGMIVTIHKHTTPRSQQSYSSAEPALYVVEVNAGFTDEHGIVAGDRIVWRDAAPQ